MGLNTFKWNMNKVESRPPSNTLYKYSYQFTNPKSLLGSPFSSLHKISFSAAYHMEDTNLQEQHFPFSFRA